MRTRNRFLPVLLLVLAAFTLATLTAPVASAIRRPPPVPDYVNVGDPDETGGSNKLAAPPTLREPIGSVDDPPRTCAPLAPVLGTETATSVAPNKGEWSLRDILLYVLFQSPVLR
jgi:hypothetical protein